MHRSRAEGRGLLLLGSVRLGSALLRELHALHSERNPLLNLEGISPVQDLTIIASQLPRLVGLGAVPQLRRLELRDNERFSGLREATFPEEMDEVLLHGQGLDDLGALGQVTALRDLSISETWSQGPLTLQNLRQLSSLRLRGNSALGSGIYLPALEHADRIAVSDNAVLVVLDGFTALRSVGELVIADNPYLVALALPNLQSAGSIYVRGNSLLADTALAPLRLLPDARLKIVSNGSGLALLQPCPWVNDGVCDESLGDCAFGSDALDYR